jgi:hypothetical protein
MLANPSLGIAVRLPAAAFPLLIAGFASTRVPCRNMPRPTFPGPSAGLEAVEC